MKYFLSIAGILAVLLIFEIARELHTFRVTHYKIRTNKYAKADGELKIALLSDLHNWTYGKHNRKLLDCIKREQPDIILVAGDMLVGKVDVPAAIAEEFMVKVSQIAPVFYGNGNHEQRMKERTDRYGERYIRYKEILTKAGVHFIENESEEFCWKNERIRITGLEIPLFYYEKFQSKKLSVEEIQERVGESDENCMQILIAHNPAHGNSYARWGADLVVSGHLHGGIVRLPFLGGMITPQIRLFPKYSGGIYHEGHTDIVVSKGLGSHTFPIRLFNEAELVMLHVKGTR